MPIKQGTYYYIKPNGTTDTLEVYDEVLATTEHIYAIPFGTRVVYTAMVEPDYGTASKYRAPQYNSSKALAIAYRLQIPLDEASWKDIKSVVESGVAKDFWKVGDVTTPFSIKGTIDGVSVDTTARAQIIGIEHNPTYEGINNVHFAIVAESTTKGGNSVMLTALGTHKHHTSTTNIGGWRLSDIRPVCEEVFAALPADMRAVISYSPKYTDNKGYRDGNIYSDSVSYTYNHIWVPAITEYNNSASPNTYERNYQAQYSYMTTAAHRNSLGAMWSRVPVITGSSQYSRLYNGAAVSYNANTAYNILFCFAVGGYNGDTSIGSTAGPGPGGTAGAKPGGLIVKTGTTLNFKLLRSLPFFLKDIATINNTVGTISAEDIFFLGDASTYGQYDNKQAGSGANLQLYFQGLKLTGSATPNVIIIKAAAGGYDESIIQVPFTVTKTDTTLTLNKTAINFTSKTSSQNTTVTLTSNQEDNVTPVITSTAGTITQYKEDSLTDGTLEYRWIYQTSSSTQPSSLYIRNRKKGDITITIKYPETDRFLEISKTIVVTNSVYLGDLDALTPAEIQQIINDGQAANVWKVGDTLPVSLTGTVGTCNMTGNYKIVIIGIDHNPTIEGTKKVHCMLKAESDTKRDDDDIEIAFVDDGYDTNGVSTSGAANYFQHNIGTSSSFDINGYYSSQFRNKITSFVNLFPSSSNNNLRGLIKTHLKTYYISGTNGDTNPHAVRDKMFLLSYYELMGATASNINNSSGTQKQYDYFKNLNTRKRKYKHNDTSVIAGYHTRDIQQYSITNSTTAKVDNITRYVIWSNNNLSVGVPSNNWYDSGFVPCFVWAAEEPTTVTVVTKPSYTDNWSVTYNGNNFSPTVGGKQLNTYTGWKTVTGDGIYKYRVDAGDYYIYCDVYETAEPGNHRIKLVLKDTINTAWESVTGNSTNIIINWVINKISVNVPTIQTGTSTVSAFVLNGNVYEREYSGSNITPSVQNKPAASIATQNTNSITTAQKTGTYYIQYDLVDSAHYQWKSGDNILSGASYNLGWRIIPRKIAKPVAVSEDESRFTVKNNSATVSFDTKQYSIQVNNHSPSSTYCTRTFASGTNFTNPNRLRYTNAGTYSVTYSLNNTTNGTYESKYQWDDGTTRDVTITLTINKASVKQPTVQKAAFDYAGSNIDIRSSDYLNNYEDQVYINYNGDYSKKDIGKYTLRVTLKYKDSTYWDNNQSDTGEKTISWEIQQATINKPGWRRYSGTRQFDYEAQDIDVLTKTQSNGTLYIDDNYVNNANKMVVTDHKKKDIGEYEVVFRCNNGYIFNTGNTEESLKWKINAVTITLKVSKTSFNYSGDSYFLEYTLTASSDNIKSKISIGGVTNAQTGVNTYITTFKSSDANVFLKYGQDTYTSNDNAISIEWKINAVQISGTSSRPVVTFKGTYGNGSSIPTGKAVSFGNDYIYLINVNIIPEFTGNDGTYYFGVKNVPDQKYLEPSQYNNQYIQKSENINAGTFYSSVKKRSPFIQTGTVRLKPEYYWPSAVTTDKNYPYPGAKTDVEHIIKFGFVRETMINKFGMVLQDQMGTKRTLTGSSFTSHAYFCEDGKIGRCIAINMPCNSEIYEYKINFLFDSGSYGTGNGSTGDHYSARGVYSASCTALSAPPANFLNRDSTIESKLTADKFNPCTISGSLSGSRTSLSNAPDTNSWYGVCGDLTIRFSRTPTNCYTAIKFSMQSNVLISNTGSGSTSNVVESDRLGGDIIVVYLKCGL